MSFLQPHEPAALVGLSTYVAVLLASRARGETRVRPAGPSRTVTTSLAIEFRSAAAPRADQTHLQHHAIFGGVARRTEKEFEKISRLPAKALFPAGRPSPPTIAERNGARARETRFSGKSQGLLGL
jgi:hypothetical protein